MQRHVCALLLCITGGALGVAACGELRDEGAYCTNAELKRGDPKCGRPLEVEYLTAAIFAPSCGQAQCHSKFRQAGNRIFDNPDDVRKTLLSPEGGTPLLQFTSDAYDPDREPGEVSNLIAWMLPLNQVNAAVGRMPFDAPLPERDLDLLKVWIRNPIDSVDKSGSPITLPGGTAHGAQCDPSLYDGFACNKHELVKCQADFNFGETDTSCSEAKGCQITEVSGRMVARCAP